MKLNGSRSWNRTWNRSLCRAYRNGLSRNYGISALVTDVEDQMCWWQDWDVGERFSMLVTDLIHWEKHQHNEVANIMILPPTSQISHHHKVTNITMSPTSLSPKCFFINHFGKIVKSSCICICISFDMWNCIWTRTRSWHWNRKSFYSTFSSSFMFQEAQNGFKNLFQRSVRLVKIE